MVRPVLKLDFKNQRGGDASNPICGKKKREIGGRKTFVILGKLDG